MDEYSWASAVGRIRIKEKEFLSRAELMEAASADGLPGALGVLRDTVYGPRLSGQESAPESTRLLAPALEGALNDAYAYARGIAPGGLFLTAFRARHDFHNLKVLAKAAYLGRGGEEPAFSRVGNLDISDLRAVVSGPSPKEGSSSGAGDLPGPSLRQPEAFPDDIALERKVLTEFHRTAMGLVETEKDAVPHDRLALGVDSLIDRAYYGWAASVYRRSGHEGLISFMAAEVDILNLKIAARAARLGIPHGLVAEMLLPGGTVTRDSLVEALRDGVGALPAVYKGTEWAFLAQAGVSLCLERRSLSTWEKDCDNALMAVVRRARHYPLGPEPVLGFIFGKEAEVRNLRVILSGKESQASSREISERLRDPYV